MKSIIKKIIITGMCVLSVFISCDDDDEHHDDDPNWWAYRLMQQHEQHKEYQAWLPSEILAVFNNSLTAEHSEKN